MNPEAAPPLEDALAAPQKRGTGSAIKLAATILVLTGFLATAVRADDPNVLQIKQKFEPGAAELKAGESLTFLNADDVNHNLKSVAPSGVATDYGVEKPGETTKITFETAGNYSIICAIHPRMKMTVTVR